MPSPRRRLIEVFLGPHGLRAGWSAALYMGVLAAIMTVELSVLRLLRRFLPHVSLPAAGASDGFSPSLVGGSELVLAIAAVGATIIMAALERRRLADYGFSMRRAAFRFASGLAWGFVSLSLLIALLVVTGHESIDGIAMGGPAALEYAVIWAVVFLLVGISEETIFRGYLQATVTRGMGFWPAAILLSFLFGLIHKGNGEEAAIGLIGAGSAGLLFTYALWRSGSLWWPIGFHTSWDWAQSFFYGTPDSGTRSAGHFLMSHPTGSILWSGGSVGPEGSLFVFLALAFAALIVRLTVKRDPDETPTFSSAGVDVGPQGQDVGR